MSYRLTGRLGGTMATIETQDQPRIDSLDKVTGRAEYTEDTVDPPGTVCGQVLLSPYSHARIRSIDSSKAEQLPGVLSVLTREHLKGLNPIIPRGGGEGGGGPFASKHLPDQAFIATEKVRFDGDVVAAVAAETSAIADYAIELIEVEYEELIPIFDPLDAIKEGAPLLHEAKGSNVVGEFNFGWGDVDKAFKESTQVFEDTFVFVNVFHHPMENVGVCVAEFRDRLVTLTAPIQHIYNGREEICSVFGLEPDQVRIKMPYIGGGFGAKELKPSMLCAIWLARETGRPVKMASSVQESFRNDSRHYIVYKAKIGVDPEGIITAMDIDLLVEAGAYQTGSMGATRLAGIASWGPYRTPNLRVHAPCVYTNKVPAGSFRGVGKAQVTWGCESLIDSVARGIGVDPLEFRRKNILHRGEQVVEGTTPLDADFVDLMDRASEAIGWDGLIDNNPEATDSRIVKGRGMAVSLRHGYLGSGRSYAIATIDRRGTVTIRQNATEIGEGIYSIVSRVASETLGIPQEYIRVTHPDTFQNPYYDGVSSQRSTVCMGNAVQEACEDLKRELIEVASKSKGGSPEEWRVAEGRLWRGEEDFSFGEIASSLGGAVTVMGSGAYSTARAENPFGGIVPHWAVSVAAAEVEVDIETGHVKLLKFGTVVDVGKAIIPVSAKAQVEGGATMGIGNALFEECVYRDGQFLNGDDMQYRLPLMEDIPEWWETVMVENEDGPGPMGSKGMAQTSIVVVAPAIGNAIYDATGIRIKQLPITPERVLQAMGKV
jgi:CO/xanthine dehydrogenase Mo-binding subunit